MEKRHLTIVTRITSFSMRFFNKRFSGSFYFDKLVSFNQLASTVMVVIANWVATSARTSVMSMSIRYTYNDFFFLSI